MPDFFIRSLTIPSSLATALSTALSGSGIAGISGGGTSDRVGRRRRCRFSRFRGAAPHQREEHYGSGGPGQCAHDLNGSPAKLGSTSVPPRVERRDVSGADALPRFGHDDTDARRIGGPQQPLDGLGPRMRREPERRPVDRHQHSRVGLGDVAVGADGLLGVHVDVGPRLGDTRRSGAASGRKAHGRHRCRRSSWCSRCRRRRTRGAAARRSPTTPTAWYRGSTTARRSAGRACTPASVRRSCGSRSSRVRRCDPPGCPTCAGARRLPSGTKNGARWVRARPRIVSTSRWS